MFAISHSYIIIILWTGVMGCDYKLQLIQMIYRHGDRAPVTTYPNDPNPSTFWKAGLGKLTLLGKRQHWSLGQLLRIYYNDFITTSPTEIDVKSCSDDRCINSAATNIASFYAPKDDWLFYSNIYWQPIPIHSSEKDDKYLNQLADCPKAEVLEEEYRNSSFIDKHKEMCDYLSLHSGHTIKDWFSFVLLSDILQIEKIHNLIIPSWVDPYWNEFLDVACGLIYEPYKNPKIQYFRGGPLLGLIIDNMKRKASGNLTELKVQVYSAHDTGVAVILACLNYYVPNIVPYAATLIFELYSGPSENNFVRVLYFNSTEPERVMQKPYVLIIDGCQEFCPLDYLIEFTKHLIPKNWEKECHEVP